MVIRAVESLPRSIKSHCYHSKMEKRPAAKIAAVTLDCQTSVSALLSAVTSKECCVSDFLNPRDVEQMQDRFDQWAGNLGALQPFASPQSLEHRLRDVPLIRESIIHSLEDLYSSIQAGKFPLKEAFNMLMSRSDRYCLRQTPE